MSEKSSGGARRTIARSASVSCQLPDAAAQPGHLIPRHILDFNRIESKAVGPLGRLQIAGNDFGVVFKDQ